MRGSSHSTIAHGALLVILLLLCSSFALADSPTLLFSDLTSGPATGLGDGKGQGAIVTIWGKNLGTPAVVNGVLPGDYHVYVGNGSTWTEASYVYEWANATQHPGHPADLFTYHKMQGIMFSLGASTPSGAQQIKVIVDGVESTTLPFTVRSGNIFWVATTGSDGNVGSYAAPWQHPGYFWGSYGTASSVAPGDILYVRDGVSVVDADNGGSGVEYKRTGGTEALPYFMAAYPGAQVVIQGTSRAFGTGYNRGKTAVYGHISKITLKAPNAAYHFIEHGRTIACELTDHPTAPCYDGQSGLVSARGASTEDGDSAGVNGNVFLGNYLHDYCNGLAPNKLQHTMYISNRNARVGADAWEMGWNYLKNNWALYGIHVYDEHACTNWNGTVAIHDNVVVDQRGPGIDIKPGCDATHGPITTTFDVFNNLVIRSGRGPGSPQPLNNVMTLIGMEFGTAANNGDITKAQYAVNVYNNTVYGAGECPGTEGGCRMYNLDGAIIRQGNIAFNEGYSAINLKNNIFYDTNNYPWTESGSSTPTTHSNNLWYSTTPGHAAPPAWDTNPLTSDPLFVDPAGGDFHPQTIALGFAQDSPVCGAGDPSIGPDIGAVSCNATFTPQSCGNGVCGGTETCASCQEDCGACPTPYCGDTICNNGETCSSCPGDCPTTSGQVCCLGSIYPGDCCSDSNCVSPQTCTNHVCTQSSCGDNTCDNGETCATCPGDCGTCQENQSGCNGRVLLLRFDNSSDLQDHTPAHNNPVCTSCPTWTPDGKLGGGLQFDGESNFLTLPDLHLFGAEMHDGTFAAWVKLDTAAGCYDNGKTHLLYSSLYGSNSFASLLYEGGSSVRWSVIIGGTDYNHNTVTSQCTDNEVSNWTFMAMTWNTTGAIQLYKNGILVGQNFTHPLSFRNTPIYRIGSDSHDYLRGSIDEVAIYNRVLSQSEIQQAMSTSACNATGGPGDVNNDGIVDLQDLLYVTSRFHAQEASADLNDDSNVDLFDVMVVMKNWGTTY